MTLRLFADPPRAVRPRRPMLNAAAQEALQRDWRTVGWTLFFAGCIGAGLAIGIHFEEIRLRFFLSCFDGGALVCPWG